MNTDRLLREVEKRLSDGPEQVRLEVLDALREEIARERRRQQSPEASVEVERERRQEAETLREVLEAINRQARLEETIEEVLKQLARLVNFESCSVALLESGGLFRIIAGRGFPPEQPVVGLTFKDELSEEIRRSPRPIALQDVHEDPRFVDIQGTKAIRSWAAVPLLVEGELIGLLCLDRYRVEPFDEEELHRAKAVAFSAAAAIRKAQLLEQVRRYAVLMERVVEVDHAVFAGKGLPEVIDLILRGALRIGSHQEGLLILNSAAGRSRVAAATEGFAALAEKEPPPVLTGSETRRLERDEVVRLAAALGVEIPAHPLYVVPLAAANATVGTIVLCDQDGETPDDRLMESYASRAATAYLHAVRQAG